MTDPTPSLNDPAVRSFLEHGTRTGKLAWVSPRGFPHVAPIWFALDGDTVVFNTGVDTAKGKSMAAQDRVSLVVDLEEPPYGFVKIDARAELIADLDEVRRWATVLGGRYMGEERAEEFGRRNGVPGELLVRLHPIKVTAALDVSG